MTANIYILNNTFCNGADKYNGKLLKGMVCAGLMSGEQDACTGLYTHHCCFIHFF